jgi:opacity protein-like surface antigen
MKLMFLAGAAVAAMAAAAPALAADMPVKAPFMRAPAVFSWTGCYVGAHVGWGWSRKTINELEPNNSSGSGPTSFSASGNIDASGAVFGGQVGCNYQFSGNWVAGVEFSGSASDINGQNIDPMSAFFETDTDNFNHVKMDWLTSVTARLGFASGDVLYYVKGGGAWAHDRWNVSGTLLGTPLGERTQTRSGWTVGGGAEWAWSFAPRWSSFVEYDYYDFGRKNLANASDGLIVGSVTSFDVKQTLHVVKIGVNYRLWGGQ